MERRSERISSGTRSGTVVDARTSLALWLRAGRAQRGITLEEVCRITKIQVRILERLEAGKSDGLPADVFVRGFVRSFAKCVGLDEEEALRRYHACANPSTVSPVAAHSASTATPVPVSVPVSAATQVAPSAAARAVLEAMADLAPTTASNFPRPRASTAGGLAAGSLRDLPKAESEPTAIAPPSGVASPSSRISSPAIVMLPATGTLTSTEIVAQSIPSLEIEIEIDTDAPVVAPTVEAAPANDSPIIVATAIAEAVELDSAASKSVDASDAKTETKSAKIDAKTDAKTDAKSKKRGRRGGKRAKRNTSRADMAIGTPAQASPVVSAKADEVAKSSAVTTAIAADSAPVITVETVDITPSATVLATTSVTSSAAEEFAALQVPASVVAHPAESHDPSSSESIAASESFEFFAPPTATDAVDDAARFATFQAADYEMAGASSATPVDEVRDVGFDEAAFEEPIATATWQPKMPTVVSSSVPWRRPGFVPTTTAPLVPSLVIDDADPDGAEQVREDRAARSQPRRSFLPPILLDREDRSARQGGLTLAVIILLIAATLTLSYLMRRPSSSGDGVTSIPASIDQIG